LTSEKHGKAKKDGIPSVHDWDDASLPLSNFHECRLGHVKVNSRRVAPSTIVRILGPIRRADVCSSHRCNYPIACRSIRTFYLVTSPTGISVVE